MSKRILAVDYGEKFIGFALSDERKKIAFPYKIIQNKGKKFFLEEIRKICQKEKIEKIIFGLPIGLSGRETKQTQRVKVLVNYLSKKINLPIELVDERMSSKIVQKTFSKKMKRIDNLSATIILQSYLEKY